MSCKSGVTFQFDGKVALITGASSGIGAETARQLAESGCALSLTGRDKECLEEVGKECQQRGLSEEKILLRTADLTDDLAVEHLIESTIKHFGKLDVLVNNAGSSVPGVGSRLFLDAKIEDFDYVYKINIRAIVQITKLCVPYLIKLQGSVVNVSSSAGTRPIPQCSIAYVMTKAAINQFTRVTALELASKNVRVNCVCPGTTFPSKIFQKSGHDEEMIKQKAKDIHPLGRTGTAQEAAQAILFLASDAASFTTGETLDTSGGRFILCPCAR